MQLRSRLQWHMQKYFYDLINKNYCFEVKNSPKSAERAKAGH